MPKARRAEGEPGDEFLALYQVQVDRLVAAGMTSFGVPADDAETLAHEVLLSFIGVYDPPVDPTAWLTGAMSYAVRGRTAVATTIKERETSRDKR